MINLYFKNFNFNLYNSIGTVIYSDLEKEIFIRRINELKLNYKIISFNKLKIRFNSINFKLTSPLCFPFQEIKGLLNSQVVILEDISVQSLIDAAILNSIFDFVLNNKIALCIKLKNPYDRNYFFPLALNINGNKNQYENMILKIYRTRLKLLEETRIISDESNNGCTKSFHEFINLMRLEKFNLDKFFFKNTGESGLIFINNKILKVYLQILPIKKQSISKNEFISKKYIILNTALIDIFFHKKEIINKIKIFGDISTNVSIPISCINKKQKNNERYKKKYLNKIQNASVSDISYAQLVLAGAGSGKTKIIVEKFLYLLNFIPAGSILVLTFTNNAVKEIKDRIASSLACEGSGEDIITYKILHVYTYHSFFYSIIKEFYKECGFDSLPFIKENTYGYSKSDRNTAISFDEIIINILKLFDSDDIVYKIAARFKYILIDEYQDLDYVSDYIIKKLDFGRGNIMYAGDDDQAIYGFNGGDSFNILFFDLFFPSGKVFVLQANYRSNYKIIKFCNSILENIEFRYPKKLIAINKEESAGKVVNALSFKNNFQEEKFIEKKIIEFKANGKTTAVLVRTKNEENRFKSILGFDKDNYVGTIHGSKGLEFDIVFIANASKGNIPHIKSMISDEANRDFKMHPFANFLENKDNFDINYNDEIKLFYVAASRAKEKIFISYSGEKSEFLRLK